MLAEEEQGRLCSVSELSYVETKQISSWLQPERSEMQKQVRKFGSFLMCLNMLRGTTDPQGLESPHRL